jgi:hypothetical protein
MERPWRLLDRRGGPTVALGLSVLIEWFRHSSSSSAYLLSLNSLSLHRTRDISTEKEMV